MGEALKRSLSSAGDVHEAPISLVVKPSEGSHALVASMSDGSKVFEAKKTSIPSVRELLKRSQSRVSEAHKTNMQLVGKPFKRTLSVGDPSRRWQTKVAIFSTSMANAPKRSQSWIVERNNRPVSSVVGLSKGSHSSLDQVDNLPVPSVREMFKRPFSVMSKNNQDFFPSAANPSRMSKALLGNPSQQLESVVADALKRSQTEVADALKRSQTEVADALKRSQTEVADALKRSQTAIVQENRTVSSVGNISKGPHSSLDKINKISVPRVRGLFTRPISVVDVRNKTTLPSVSKSLRAPESSLCVPSHRSQSFVAYPSKRVLAPVVKRPLTSVLSVAQPPKRLQSSVSAPPTQTQSAEGDGCELPQSAEGNGDGWELPQSAVSVQPVGDPNKVPLPSIGYLFQRSPFFCVDPSDRMLILVGHTCKTSQEPVTEGNKMSPASQNDVFSGLNSPFDQV